MVEYIICTEMGLETAWSQTDASHVLLPVDEYEILLEKGYGEGVDDLISAAKLGGEQESGTKDDSEEIVRKLEMDMAELRRDLEYEKGLNKNFRRICIERANADRNLRPKTEHSGYVVLASTETEYTYYTGGKNRVKNSVLLWETHIQTPFSTNLTEKQAKKESGALFALDDNRHWPIGKIGISGRYKGRYEEMLQDKKADSWLARNVLLRIRYKANHKAGYWEMLLLHTKSLCVVPEDMRPMQTKKKKG